MPGYQVHFSDVMATNQKFICPSCGWILRDAIQTACGHLYCNTCLADKQRHDDPICITCDTSLKQTQSFPDKFVRREILCLVITCLNKSSGCMWSDNLRMADEHNGTCQYRLMPCKNDGCNSLIPLCNLQDHEEGECPYHQVHCEYCNSQETVGGLLDHLKTCPELRVNCPNCQEKMLRSQVKVHLDPINGDCTRKRCPFAEHGCAQGELMNQTTLNKHLAECLNVHVILLQRFVEALLVHSRPSAAGLSGDIRQQITAAETEIAAHGWALNNHYHHYTELKEHVNAMFGTLARCLEALASCREGHAARMQENAELRSRLEEDKTQAELRDNRLNDQLGLARACCGDLSRSVQELRSQNETHSYNGEMIWKIPDLHQKCAEAAANPNCFLQSPPFSTSRHGYKVCIRLYLNGHGREWGSKMSFFFLMMKGEYDPILSWPFFPQHIEFSLMGQGVSKGNDVVVHVQLNPQDDVSFARPVQGMNDARGAPHCAIPLENLRSEAHVDGNTIFVKVIVREK